MIRIWRFAGVGLTLSGALAMAQNLPQYVKGPLSGFAYDCRQEKPPFDSKGLVTGVDLDGDGKPDHIFDVAKGCAACGASSAPCEAALFWSAQRLALE